ncbi:MAG: T9SS type A sorting domain-containing protein [Planctomycetes bacterium]|nr:T9SS type A sorting domain-containing protein [Planctomycetota bacterium]
MTAIEEGDTLYQGIPGNYVKFRIIENLHNEFSSDTITAIGGFGGSICDISVAQIFNVGDTIISSGSFETCSRGWLRLKGTIVSGFISDDLSEIPLEEFKSSIEACTGLTNGFNVSVFPNPVTDIVFISIQDEFGSLHDIQIVSATGEICIQALQTYEDGLILSLAGLSSGIYYLYCYNASGIIHREKLMVL